MAIIMKLDAKLAIISGKVGVILTPTSIPTLTLSLILSIFYLLFYIIK